MLYKPCNSPSDSPFPPNLAPVSLPFLCRTVAQENRISNLMSSQRRTAISIAFVIAASLLTVSEGISGVNPCHKDKNLQGKGNPRVTCSNVILPPDLCRQCRLREFLSDGQFADCANIYDLNYKCREELKKYAKLNEKCDPIRAEQVKDFKNEDNRNGLDYFVYSVCEQCCDCVPIRAAVEQFVKRRDKGTLLNVNRGNCAAHAWYDICRIWPDIRSTEPYDPLLHDEEHAEEPESETNKPPKICPILFKWIKRPSNQKWVKAGWLWLDRPLKTFLSDLVVSANCTFPRTWKKCTLLEGAQNRVG